mmetsp:Transcript_21299/g.50511  ORF Transcript_21299/g.50511 Transcript_21299/m.50511 type:complete len:315 (+) Transcript_21299:728-1672(+)
MSSCSTSGYAYLQARCAVLRPLRSNPPTNAPACSSSHACSFLPLERASIKLVVPFSLCSSMWSLNKLAFRHSNCPTCFDICSACHDLAISQRPWQYLKDHTQEFTNVYLACCIALLGAQNILKLKRDQRVGRHHVESSDCRQYRSVRNDVQDVANRSIVIHIVVEPIWHSPAMLLDNFGALARHGRPYVFGQFGGCFALKQDTQFAQSVVCHLAVQHLPNFLMLFKRFPLQIHIHPDRPCHNLDRFAQSRSLGWGAVHSLFFGPILENFNVLELSVSSCLETGQGWQQDLFFALEVTKPFQRGSTVDLAHVHLI